MILDIETRKHELCVSYFNEEGEIAYQHIPISVDERYNWKICSPTDKDKDLEHVTWDGKPVKKNMLYDALKLDKYRIEEILMSKPEFTTCLHDFNIPKKYFIDIEVEVIDGFPDAATAPNKVTAIAIVNSHSHTVNIMALNDISDQDVNKIEQDINKHFKKFGDKWSFRYRQYTTEYDMLYTFFKNFLPNMSCISGWNFNGYDWPYLLNRLERINALRPDEEKIRPEWSSPIGRMHGKDRFPVHRLIVDYLEIYKKWDRVIKIRENDKLDYVSTQALGIEKIKYPGSIKDLYEKDFVKFIFYNAVDAVLVHYIDKKLNTMMTFLKLGHITGVEAKKAFSPIRIMEVLLGREFFKQKKVFVYSKGSNDEEQTSFDGAYVQVPQIGMHEWVTCYDFASLYPNVLSQFNISPETFIGNNLEPDYENGQIKVGEHTDSTGRTTWRVFDNTKDSVMRTVIKEFYKKRKDTKHKYLRINKEIDFLEKSLSSISETKDLS